MKVASCEERNIHAVAKTINPVTRLLPSKSFVVMFCGFRLCPPMRMALDIFCGLGLVFHAHGCLTELATFGVRKVCGEILPAPWTSDVTINIQA